jgi:hypothetical protein
MQGNPLGAIFLELANNTALAKHCHLKESETKLNQHFWDFQKVL